MAKKTTDEVRSRVIEIYHEFYPAIPGEPLESESRILKINPNQYDQDPESFYDALIDEFELYDDLDESDDAIFSGLGGDIGKTIDFIKSHQKEGVKPLNNDDPYCELGLFFSNLELQLRNDPTHLAECAKNVMQMFKYELRDSYKILKKEAETVVKTEQIDQVVNIARDSNIRNLNELTVLTLLEDIIKY